MFSAALLVQSWQWDLASHLLKMAQLDKESLQYS